MSFFLVDDKLHGHRKTVRTPVEAMGLWVIAGSWCADNLTDGFIPDYVAKRLDSKATRHAAALVASGFWCLADRQGDKGWLFVNWDEKQPTREQVETRRAQARDRMRNVRANNRERSRELHEKSPRSSTAVTPTRALGHGQATSGPVGGGVSPMSESPKNRPPRKCPKHINDPDPPNCRKCADARRAHDEWKPETLSAKTTMCGEHPQYRALDCPICESEAVPPPRIRAAQ